MRIDKANQRFLDYQNAKVGDVNGRELLVQITNNGVVEDQTGTTLKLNWQHENGNQDSTNFNVVDIKTGKFSVYYPKEMLYKGTVDASVEINSNGQITHTMNFKIIVHADVFDGEAGTVNGVFISLADVNKKLDDREKEYKELKERQTSVENQFDAVQQELTDKDPISAPEIIAARNGEDTLKDRLDKERQSMPIFLSDYGVSPSKTASENNILLQNAIDDASLENRAIVFPWTSGNEYIELSKRFVINDPIEITGFGRNSRVRHNFPTYVSSGENTLFDLRAKGASVHDINIYGKTGFEGGVLITGDFCRAERLGVINLLHGVRQLSYDFTTGLKRETLPQGTIIDDILSDKCCFPILIEGSRDLYFNNIRGSYKLIGSRAPHLIYFSDGRNTVLEDTSEPLGENINPIGGTSNAYNGEVSYAYQFKYVRGGNLGQLNARNCRGVINIMESSDLDIFAVVSEEDQHDSTTYASLAIDGICDNINIERVKIRNSVNGKAIRIGQDVSNSTIRHPDVETYHTAYVNAIAFDIDISGTNNTVDKPKVVNSGPAPFGASVGIWAGSGNRIIDPETSGNATGVKIRYENNFLDDYDLSKMGYVQYNNSSRAVEIDNPANIKPKLTNYSKLDYDNVIAYERCDQQTGIAGTPKTTSSGHQWNIGFGTWRTTDNRIQCTTAGNNLIYVDTQTPNVHLSSGIKLFDREGLAIRANDYNDMIMIQLSPSNNTIGLNKLVSSVRTTLASADKQLQVGRRYEVEIKAYGDLIECFIDGEKVITYTLTAEESSHFGASTNHGIRSVVGNPQGQFDNIVWKKLD